jgi:hypothetical protein
MGIQGERIRFDGAVPALRSVAAEAERLGGLKITVVDSQAGSLTLSFAAFPEGRVTLHADENTKIGIADYSLVAPILYRLLRQTLLQLGGKSINSVALLSLPLREEFVAKLNRKHKRAASIGSVALLAILAAIVALVVNLIWIQWHRS